MPTESSEEESFWGDPRWGRLGPRPHFDNWGVYYVSQLAIFAGLVGFAAARRQTLAGVFAVLLGVHAFYWHDRAADWGERHRYPAPNGFPWFAGF